MRKNIYRVVERIQKAFKVCFISLKSYIFPHREREHLQNFLFHPPQRYANTLVYNFKLCYFASQYLLHRVGSVKKRAEGKMGVYLPVEIIQKRYCKSREVQRKV
jgi:hypothetical protein